MQNEEYEVLESVYDSKNLQLPMINLQENMPNSFLGINTLNIGSSFKNPYTHLKNIVLKDSDISHKIEALRYMNLIPHVNRQKEIVNLLKYLFTIISDSTFRFKLFTKTIKLDQDILLPLHEHHFSEFKNEYNFFDCEYILSCSKNNKLLNDCKKFLQEALQTNDKYRAADILYRLCPEYSEDSDIFELIIEGNSGNSGKSVYDNSQNAHNSDITESVNDIIKSLIEEDKTEKHKDNVELLKLQKETKDSKESKESKSLDVKIKALLDKKITTENSIEELYSKIKKDVTEEKKLDKLMTVLNRLILDTFKIHNYTLSDILIIIWKKIKTSNKFQELYKRLLEELIDMNSTCSTGHLTRLVNVLSGFDLLPEYIKISYKDQLKSNVYGRLTARLKTENNNNKTIILEAIASGEKEVIQEFIDDNKDLYDELYKEFVDGKYMNKSDFDAVYNKAIKSYCGLKE